MAGLPDREELLVRGATIISMDATVGDFSAGDILVQEGRIVSIGRELQAPGARVLDAGGMVAMPGFVDTHSHLWGTLFRGLVEDDRDRSWFPLKERFGNHFTPEDSYAGVALGLADALDSGVTTVHNYAHNTVSGEDADANLQAQFEAGLRSRFSYGTPTPATWLTQAEAEEVMRGLGHPLDELMDFDDLQRIEREHFDSDEDGLVTLGVAVRGPSRTPAKVYETEFSRIRELALPMSMHCAGTRKEVARIRQVQILEAAGLLGPDLELVHCNHVSAEERDFIARSGAKVCSTPVAELRLGMGFPQFKELLDLGVLVSLGFDSSAIGGSADMFQLMRIALDAEHARHEDTSLRSRRLLQMATIDGARDLGLDAITGSLSPGKRADLILVRVDDLNTAPFADPVLAMVHSAHAGNVDTVVVDGRVLKRDGELTHLDRQAVVARAVEARKRIVARAG